LCPIGINEAMGHSVREGNTKFIRTRFRGFPAIGICPFGPESLGGIVRRRRALMVIDAAARGRHRSPWRVPHNCDGRAIRSKRVNERRLDILVNNAVVAVERAAACGRTHPRQAYWKPSRSARPTTEREPMPSRAGDTAARDGSRYSATPPTGRAAQSSATPTARVRAPRRCLGHALTRDLTELGCPFNRS
jgi:hypothetical protein